MLSQSSVAEMLPKSLHRMGLSRNSTSKACQQADTRLCIKQVTSHFLTSAVHITKDLDYRHLPLLIYGSDKSDNAGTTPA